jgi:hypothetical protein
MTRCRAALAIVAASLLAGCSADAVEEPEPTLDTPGAFVALEDDAGGFNILRTLVSLNLSQDVIFCTLFAPTAGDFEQARELAQDHDLPVQDPLVLVPKNEILARRWKVVWFRTLNEEERSVLR